ncbi:MAG: hypothetical protein M3Q29_18375 [Chloroflexota bacterium]|nr:hypothetical protein [Chloroflexota bacterium]
MARDREAGLWDARSPQPAPPTTSRGFLNFLRRFLGLEVERPSPREAEELELPWTRRWHHVPRRSAGPDFRRSDYRRARENARLVARDTLGEDLWQQLQTQGHLDLPSRRFPGVTYRLRVGLRIEVLCEPGVRGPWRYPYLCINPTYPLPEEEFFVHLYLYVRDREDEIIRVAAPQPWDQPLGRTF